MGVAAWALVISSLAAAAGLSGFLLQVINARKAAPDVHLSGRVDYMDGGLVLTLNVDNKGRGGVGLVDAWIEYGDDERIDLGEDVGLEQTLAGEHGRQWKVPITDDILGTGDLDAFVRLGNKDVKSARIHSWG